MHVAIYAGKDTSKYQKRLKALGFASVVYPLPEPSWDGVLPANAWLEGLADVHYRAYKETTDVIQILMTDWQRPRSLGFDYSRAFSGYRLNIVKHRRGWEDSAEHELLHAAKDTIAIYLGINLESVFGVASFDEDVVHGRDPRFTEYEYDEVWATIAPYLRRAISVRKGRALLSYQKQAVIALREMVARLRAKVRDITIPEEKSLLAAAKVALGTDASPDDNVPDELGCAETVSTLIGQVVDFPVLTGTWTLWDRLRSDERFKEVTSPEPGDIVISPTGTGNGTIAGHVGIVAEYGRIMSNDSADGTFDQNYDLETWRQRYAVKGGFPVYYYRLIT